jgi:peptide deformylase
MMKRRRFFKIFILSAAAATGVGGFLKIYKTVTGVGKIVEYPDPILRSISTPVGSIDERILTLSRQMIATLRYHSLVGFFSRAYLGRGLAAPQLGVAKRLIVCGIRGEIKVLVNPQVVEKRGGYTGYESCLSAPRHDRRLINRPGFLKIRYRGPDNKEHKISAAGGYAALLAHEVDHLNGILYIDRM